MWVPFELGRPLGPPYNSGFQTGVLTGALDLLEAPSGPVLADFPDDAPPVEGITGVEGPVSVSMPDFDEGDTAKLTAKFLEEIDLMRPWYNQSMDNRKRTTVGVSGRAPESMGSYIAEFLDGGIPESESDASPASQFKLAIDDLKSYYFEAATAQPGQEKADSDTLSDWFYQDTVAGNVLQAVKDAHKDTEDRTMRLITNILLIPKAHARTSPV